MTATLKDVLVDGWTAWASLAFGLTACLVNLLDTIECRAERRAKREGA